MKKFKKIVLSFILVFVCALGFLFNVLAEEQNNEEKEYGIIVNATTGNAGSYLEMKLTGINEKEAQENYYSYFVRFVSEGDEKPNLTTNPYDSVEGVNKGFDSYLSVSIYKAQDTEEYVNKLNVDYDWYMLNGYDKAYIVECDVDENCIMTDNPISVERPDLPKLTQRYQNFLFSQDDQNSLSIFPFFPKIGTTGSHEINVKIGLINDENLLKKIANEESGSLEELMEYAKVNDGVIFSKNDNVSEDIDIGDFEVVNGAYYYMYTYYTNTDGLYRNLDDITVAMGEADMLVNDVDWSRYLSNDELWELFVEKYKSTGAIEELAKDDIDVEITHTKNSLKIETSKGDIKFTTNFTYEDGVLTYVPSDDNASMIGGSSWVLNALYAVADIYDYNIEELNEWLELNKQNEFTLEKDGVEFKFSKIETEDESIEVFSSFKLDIRKGLSKFNKEEIKEEPKTEEKVNNPNTGINLGFGILTLVIMISGIGYFLIRKQSKFPKHN